MVKFKIYTKEYGLLNLNGLKPINGLTWHREDGPAYYSYDNNNIRYVAYYINNIKHRLDGPAGIFYDMDGNIIQEAYYIDGIEYTKDNYHKELLKLKVQSL